MIHPPGRPDLFAGPFQFGIFTVMASFYSITHLSFFMIYKGGQMAKKLEVYKCNLCGNIVEVLHGGEGELVCCGEPMEQMIGNTVDAAKEKHVPVMKKAGGKITVTVGSVAHPMEEKHYIEWIELVADGKAYRQFLAPGQSPEAVFTIEAGQVTARAYCNLHGLWTAAG